MKKHVVYPMSELFNVVEKSWFEKHYDENGFRCKDGGWMAFDIQNDKYFHILNEDESREDWELEGLDEYTAINAVNNNGFTDEVWEFYK